MALNRLEQLYRQVIVDAAAAPHVWGDVAGTAPLHAVNPSCGDKLDLQVLFDDGDVAVGIAVPTTGCTISQASGALMIQAIAGKSRAEIGVLADSFIAMIRDGVQPAKGLGDAAALASVHAFPARVKCALLPWTTLKQKLDA